MKPSEIKKPYSRQKVEFSCECGRKITAMYRVGIKRKNCGQCWKQSLTVGTKIRMLTLIEDIQNKRKSDKALWQCDCGTQKEIAIKSVLSGLTSSCGCKNSRPNVESCDKRPKTLNLKDFYSKKYGCYTIIDERDIKIRKGAEVKIKVQCDCGRENKLMLGSITRNPRKTCGKCNHIFLTCGQKFGRLTIAEDILEISRYSEKKVLCKCSCGNNHNVAIKHLKNTKSCGKCSQAMIDWWKNKGPISNNRLSINNKYSLEYLEEYFEGSKLKPLHSVDTMSQNIKIKCCYCGKNFTTKLAWLYSNKTKSCGCISNNISRLSNIVGDWAVRSTTSIAYEYTVDNYTYDIRAKDILIECHGLVCHSKFRDTREIDRKKRETAIGNGFRYIMLYEDEIMSGKAESFIRHLLHDTRFKVRTNKLEFTKIHHRTSHNFLDDHHYLGSCGAKYHFGAYYDDSLIAVMSFSHPVRQNITGIELKRFCLHSDYKVYGLGSWMLKRAMQDGIKTPIVSYSDNRLHDGRLYKKMGFRMDSKVKQDYYWVKNSKRYNKSGLRKPQGCDVTEAELRTSEGYYKIWDLGKTKWVLD